MTRIGKCLKVLAVSAKKTGRPPLPEGDKRTKRIILHATEQELWRLRAAAEADDARELAPWLLRLGLQRAGAAGFTAERAAAHRSRVQTFVRDAVASGEGATIEVDPVTNAIELEPPDAALEAAVLAAATKPRPLPPNLRRLVDSLRAQLSDKERLILDAMLRGDEAATSEDQAARARLQRKIKKAAVAERPTAVAKPR